MSTEFLPEYKSRMVSETLIFLRQRVFQWGAKAIKFEFYKDLLSLGM